VSDFDSPWKEILEELLELCFALLFPGAHAQINWNRRAEFMDKELQQLFPQSEVGRRYVDKLVKVWRKSGEPLCILIHIEVQTQREVEFPQRMFEYNYRAFDRFRMVVASFAILADDAPDWRPDRYEQGAFGSVCGLTYPVAKLWDWVGREDVLEKHDNPFALVVLAHLRALQSRDDPAERLNWKTHLVQLMYQRGMSAQEISRLFRFIDWIMDLPPALEQLFWTEVERVQKEKQMPFITTPERIGRKIGLKAGIRKFLRFRFGATAEPILAEIEALEDLEVLTRVLDASDTVDSPEKLRSIWSEAHGQADSAPTP
jgi:hypothetical protein